MHLIPLMNIDEFFKFIHKPFKLQSINIPETKYVGGNISIYETIILCLICKNFNPKHILEFGTFTGRSTINMASNIQPDAKIITVDLPEEKETKYPLIGSDENDFDDETGYIGIADKVYMKHIDRYKIKQLWMDSAQFPVNDYKDYFDIIFVDASHSYENVLNDTKTVMKCIKKEGIILWHDYGNTPEDGWDGVKQALNEIYEQSVNKYSFAHIKDTSLVIFYNNNNSIYYSEKELTIE